MRFFGAVLSILLVGSAWADDPVLAPIGLSRDPMAIVNAHFDSWFGCDHQPSDEGCVRGEATSWLRGRLPPGTHAYRSSGPLEAIETFARDDGANLTIVHSARELPLAGDGVEFLQTRIILERDGLLDDGRTGFVELRLVKGPL